MRKCIFLVATHSDVIIKEVNDFLNNPNNIESMLHGGIEYNHTKAEYFATVSCLEDNLVEG